MAYLQMFTFKESWNLLKDVGSASCLTTENAQNMKL